MLKEITAALLETDVNVKLVASLRNKVKQKVKALLEQGAGDKAKETNRKHLIQKVTSLLSNPHISTILTSHDQAVFDELVSLVDPGIEPYKPKKGQSNIIMLVGLQVRHKFPVFPLALNLTPRYNTRETVKQQHAPN